MVLFCPKETSLLTNLNVIFTTILLSLGICRNPFNIGTHIPRILYMKQLAISTHCPLCLKGTAWQCRNVKTGANKSPGYSCIFFSVGSWKKKASDLNQTYLVCAFRSLLHIYLSNYSIQIWRRGKWRHRTVLTRNWHKGAYRLGQFKIFRLV